MKSVEGGGHLHRWESSAARLQARTDGLDVVLEEIADMLVVMVQLDNAKSTGIANSPTFEDEDLVFVIVVHFYVLLYMVWDLLYTCIF